MKFSSIRIEGAILSADILDKIEQGEIPGQKPSDFGLDGVAKVKDEIVRAWADAQDYWRMYQRKVESLKEGATGVTETRNLWTVPLLGLLGYRVEYSGKGEEVHGKNFVISHRVTDRDHFPVHIVGFRDSMDKKSLNGGPRMSPHGLVQEYLNLTEHLYALVTNGCRLRLLRDSSRLIKLSFLEFDLDRMMGEELFTDFALLYRLLHVSRIPVSRELCAESLIEQYHQDSLDSGSRIREGLSLAVEDSIKILANGFLNHKENQILREAIADDSLEEMDFYLYQLRLIYRFLFLMVIEERDLVYPPKADLNKKKIYYNYYSLQRLRKLSEKNYLTARSYQDCWMGITSAFHLFQGEGAGEKLGIRPLAGDLFSYNAIGLLNELSLDNESLLKALRNLTIFKNPITNQVMRVNYSALNVEEFGSVYEGLLEYDPVITEMDGRLEFTFKKGEGRSTSGSHYTPDELVKPLIQHSLDYIIEEKLKGKNREQALLSIRVCDAACGSGHILLNAARRIANELAVVRTGEEQPSPVAFREAVRDVIRNCIYGVDLNPLAVELCKVALWLEAHNPGEPLNFLDHHIKCGNAIVGLAQPEELERGIAEEAFKTLPGDDKETASALRKRNKRERDARLQMPFDYGVNLEKQLGKAQREFRDFASMPEKTPGQIEKKKKQYEIIKKHLWNLRVIANIQVGQFFIPKTQENQNLIITDEEYRRYLKGERHPTGQGVSRANAIGFEKRFFHWFLEFPDVFEKGGFDCILGNPPFLGGQRLSGNFGNDFLNWVKTEYAPAGSVDIVTYFFRRIFGLIKMKGFQALISTNTIAQGSAREGGLEVMVKNGGTINFAIRSTKWPGRAAVEVALVSIHKGPWKEKYVLDNKTVSRITSYLDDAEALGEPNRLDQNSDKSFQGSIVLGKGFILPSEKARELIEKKSKNKEVLFPYINGEDINSRPNQSPSRWVINFFDWPEDRAREYSDCIRIVEKEVKPERTRLKPNGQYVLRKPLPEKWWIYAEKRPKLYRTIKNLNKVLVIALTSKTVAVSFEPVNIVFSHATGILAFEKYIHFLFLQSSFHFYWAWKYASSMKNDLRYTPSAVFETFAFPQNISKNLEEKLEKIGATYHEYRRQLMLKMQLGLTKTYNLFHSPEVKTEASNPDSKALKTLQKHLDKTKGTCAMEEAIEGIVKLRLLHKEMDEAALEAYGWSADIKLAHNFYEVDFLPENDRIRYTIPPETRKEILKRLLLLNHEIYKKEVAQGLHDKKKPFKKKAKGPSTQRSLAF